MHMVEKLLNNTTPYGKIRAPHEVSLHSSTLSYARWIQVDLLAMAELPQQHSDDYKFKAGHLTVQKIIHSNSTRPST